MRGRYVALTILALGAGLILGVLAERNRAAATADAAAEGPRILYWVAPMDPNFRRDGPGKSPMGMDLVPVYEGQETGGDPAEVRLSPVEINAIGVRTAVARVEPVAERIETVGYVRFDEHATSHVHMRVPGWVERLAVRAVGDPVARGELLFELYAPEITIASSELLRAVRRNDSAEIAVTRRKLRNFGVSERQIDEMAEAGEPAETIRVYAPQDGVVVGLEAADGMFLEPRTRAVSLSDLSTVWLVADVFERDIGRLSADMVAEVRLDALPGRVFEGRVDYIFPELDPVTRTLPVRVRLDNREGLLRPNMFATVALTPPAGREAVTVPSEAVIRTGRAERVILATGEGRFRPRLVTAGLRDGFGRGGRTEIVQGLAPGEVVVASAQFLIDSESALSAGMMRFAPTDAEPATGRGVLVALDPKRRAAEIDHEPVAALDWPAMTTRFAVAAGVDLGRVAPGDAVRFAAVRGADGLLALTALGPDDGIDATGTGIVHAVTPDGRLSLSHDPIPALGWPAMRMDMDVAGLDPQAVPLGVPVRLALGRDEAGLYVVVGVEAEGAEPDRVAANAPGARAEPGSPAATGPGPAAARPAGAEPEPMTATGRIDAVDPAARTATVTHGPLAAIGMPGMTMDFPLAEGLDPAALPLGREVVLSIAAGDDFSLTLVGVAEPEGAR